MRHHDARAVGQMAFVAVVWLSCLPVVSATCDLSTLVSSSCGMSKQAVIGVIVAGVVFVIICCLRFRQRRPQTRAVPLSQVSRDRMGRRSLSAPKPYNPPALGSYPTYYQAAPPAPPPVPMPQYPPRGYDTRHNHSRSQSTARTIPELTAPMRPPSSVTSRPISSYDTTSTLRSSVPRDDSMTIVLLPYYSPSPGLPQTNVTGSPLLSLPSSPPPRSPSVAIPPASAPSPPPSGAIQLPSAARPFALSPIHTGTSNNIDEPPPAYTPV